MGEACQRIQSMAHEARCCTYRVAGPINLEFPLHELTGRELPGTCASHANIRLLGVDGVIA
jgi:hypothetical protein